MTKILIEVMVEVRVFKNGTIIVGTFIQIMVIKY